MEGANELKTPTELGHTFEDGSEGSCVICGMSTRTINVIWHSRLHDTCEPAYEAEFAKAYDEASRKYGPPQ